MADFVYLLVLLQILYYFTAPCAAQDNDACNTASAFENQLNELVGSLPLPVLALGFGFIVILAILPSIILTVTCLCYRRKKMITLRKMELDDAD